MGIRARAAADIAGRRFFEAFRNIGADRPTNGEPSA
jgi:hypothetical protein